jgi:hypothetical protein
MVTATLKRGTDGGSTGGLIWPNSAVQEKDSDRVHASMCSQNSIIKYNIYTTTQAQSINWLKCTPTTYCNSISANHAALTGGEQYKSRSLPPRVSSLLNVGLTKIVSAG